jgi:hypothetical protein
LRAIQSNTNTNTNPNPKPNSNVYSYGDSYSDRNAHSYIYAHADVNSDADSNSDIHSDAYTDSDGDSNSYTYFDTKTFTDAESCANAEAACHAATAPVALTSVQEWRAELCDACREPSTSQKRCEDAPHSNSESFRESSTSCEMFKLADSISRSPAIAGECAQPARPCAGVLASLST